MDKPGVNNHSPDVVAEAVVVSKSNVSYIWIIPLVAVLIAGWLAYKSILEQGPTITISFSNAAGIEAGKTKIRYKDVDIGHVTEMSLSTDLSQVFVTVQLKKGTERYLSKETRFWIVKARVKAGEISGIDTLFSGVYIAVDPVMNGESVRHFIGLEKPPVVTSAENGRHYVLRARSLGSLNLGSPVYFRQIEVGQVTSYQLSKDSLHVDINIFVRSPYYKLVTTGTRFWDASGLDINLDANGLQVNSENMMTMVLGGISFETPVTIEEAIPAEKETVFEFYESRKAAQVKRYANKSYYLVYFSESVRGLVPGAPVEFRGMQIGQVADVRIEFDIDRLDVRIPVLIEVEPERFNIISQAETEEPVSLANTHDVFEALVAKGLRAQLKTANLLMGQLVVDLDFFEDAPISEVQVSGVYPVLPTVPNQLDEITTGLAKIVDKINTFPIDKIGRNLEQIVTKVNRLVSDPELASTVSLLNESLTSIKSLSGNLNEQSVPALNAALTQAEDTLGAAHMLIGPDAPVGRELSRLMIELSEAARAVRQVADYLERHPEALIYGKED